MATTKENLLALAAESITVKHDLAAADVFSLADDVSNGWTRVTPFSAYGESYYSIGRPISLDQTFTYCYQISIFSSAV